MTFSHTRRAAGRPRAARSAFAHLTGVALVTGATAAAGVAGPDLCEGLPTHTDRVEVRPVKKPPFMKRYRDPAFGATVMRITDSATGEVFKPAYSTVQAWNADESRMILYRSGPNPGHVLLDGRSYEYIKDLDMFPSDLEEVFWSHSDPNVFYYVSKYKQDLGRFQRYDVRDDSKELVREFPELCGKGVPTAGGDPHMQSLDDDLFGFRCRDDAGKWKAFTYRVSTDEIHVMDLGEGTDYDEWRAPGIGPSGRHVILESDSLNADLSTVEATFDMAKDHEHSNLGTTHDGQDALFQTVFDPSPDGCAKDDMWNGVGHLTVHVLATGECRPVVNEADGYPYTTSGTHVSAQAYRRPGWVVMSSIGRADQFEFFTNGRKAPALLSEIYLVNTDPENETVCRVAQHRSFAKHAKTGGYTAYFGEPHATASPSGTRIVFGSDWYDSGSVDAYVVELPAYDPEG